MSFTINVPALLYIVVALLCSISAWESVRESTRIPDCYEYVDSVKDTYHHLMLLFRLSGIVYAIAGIAFLICALSILRIVTATSTSFTIILCVGYVAVAIAVFCDGKAIKLVANVAEELDHIKWQGILQDIKIMQKWIGDHARDGSSNA